MVLLWWIYQVSIESTNSIAYSLKLLLGLKDANLACVRATEEYIFKSDHIFIVTNIKRAIDSGSSLSTFKDVLAPHIPNEWKQCGVGRLNVTVICTHSEVFQLPLLDTG